MDWQNLQILSDSEPGSPCLKRGSAPTVLSAPYPLQRVDRASPVHEPRAWSLSLSLTAPMLAC